MDEARYEAKFQQIETAAYQLLASKGYEATSMLAIAKASGTSNQTLYKWFGDKRGLFAEMVARNAAEVRKLLEEAIRAKSGTEESLRAIGPILLGMVTGEKAISLNRAAAADHSGQLGDAIAEAGRQTIFPLIRELVQSDPAIGSTGTNAATELTTLYLNLLIGDLQIRRAIGVLKPLSEEGIRERADFALSAFLRLRG